MKIFIRELRAAAPPPSPITLYNERIMLLSYLVFYPYHFSTTSCISMESHKENMDLIKYFFKFIIFYIMVNYEDINARANC